MTYTPTALRREVVERAGNRCEYCRLQAEVAFFPCEVDHVIAGNTAGRPTWITWRSHASAVTVTRGATSHPLTHRPNK